MNVNTALVTDTSRAVTEASVNGYRDKISQHVDQDWTAHMPLQVIQTPYVEIVHPLQFVVASSPMISAQLRMLLTYRDGSVDKTEAFIAPVIFSGTTVAPPTTAPRFLRLPVDTTVRVGEAAQFTAYVASSTPITYQWQNRTLGLLDIREATGPNYGIPVVALSDQGTYALVATNLVGTTSGVVRLTVLP